MSSQDRPWADHRDGQYNDKGYALSGRIMLSAIVVLFFVVVLMVCLHIYARWYLLRARRRSHRRRRSARGNLVFHVDGAAAAASRGLDAAVLRALPVFVVGKESAAKVAGECAVCLSEFEAGEAGRRLPKCGHSFHTECIDMWFHSHSTCPLCRSPVEAGSEPEIRLEIDSAAVDLDRTGPVSGPASPHGLCSDCEASSSVESRRKPAMSVSIDVPRRNLESFGESGSAESPASHTTPFRSPMSRMLSLTRILSREKRNGCVSPSGNFNGNNFGNNSASCSSVNELDIERGKEVTQ